MIIFPKPLSGSVRRPHCKTCNKITKKVTAAILLLAVAGFGQMSLAATYELPDGNLPKGCVYDGNGVVSCGAVSLGANDTVNLSKSINWKMTELSAGNNSKINPGNNFDLVIEVTGSVSVGNNNVINAAINAGDAVRIGNGVDMTGSINAGGKVLVGDGNGVINGNIISDEGRGEIVIGNTTVNGYCNPNVPQCSGQPADSYDYIDLRFAENAALTCESLPIKAYACNDDSGCDYYTDKVSISFQTTAGSFFPSSAIYESESNPAVSNLAVTQPVEVNISVTADPQPTGPIPLYCNGKPADGNSCTIKFADARFIFENATGETDLNRITRYSGKPSDIQLRAVRKDDQTQTCIAALEGSQTVGFGFECINPDTCHSSNPDFLVNDIAISANDSGAGISYTNQTLTFDANGVADLQAIYFDAGLVALHAKADIKVEQETVEITGKSEAFSFVPAGLCVAMDQSESGYNCSDNPDASCSVFKAAGEEFTLNISARIWQEDFGESWDNRAAFCDTAITPNFAMDAIDLVSSVVAPEDGVDGALIPETFGIEIGNTPTDVITAQSEVGVFDIQAIPGEYFGHPMIGGVLAQVGRFTPAYFTLENAQVNHGCAGEFTYMDQPYSLSFNLIPRAGMDAEGNKVYPGTQTQNYRDGFVRFDEDSWYQQGNGDLVIGLLEPEALVDDLTKRLDAHTESMTMPSVDNFARGAFVYPLQFNRLNPEDGSGIADGPFELIYSITNMADLDNVFVSASEGNNLYTEDIRFDTAPASMRHGRLTLGQDHYYRTTGSDAALEIDAVAEYFDSSIGRWRHNTDDTCSDLAGVDIRLLNNVAESAALGNEQDQIMISEDGETTRNPVGSWDLGKQPIEFTAPGGQAGGFVDVIPQLATDYPWLQFTWDGDSRHSQNPRGRASWGIFRGEDSVIHIQEIWN